MIMMQNKNFGKNSTKSNWKVSYARLIVRNTSNSHKVWAFIKRIDRNGRINRLIRKSALKSGRMSCDRHALEQCKWTFTKSTFIFSVNWRRSSFYMLIFRVRWPLNSSRESHFYRFDHLLIVRQTNFKQKIKKILIWPTKVQIYKWIAFGLNENDFLNCNKWW